MNNNILPGKNDIFEEVKTIPLVSILEKYSPNTFKGRTLLCPFHNDKHPSLSFKGQIWRCWSCGASGDGINFVARLYGLRPIEAAKQIASDFGLNWGSTSMDPDQIAKILKQKEIREYEKQWQQAIDTLYSRLCKIYQVIGKYLANGGYAEWSPLIHEEPLLECCLDTLQFGSKDEILNLIESGLIRRWIQCE